MVLNLSNNLLQNLYIIPYHVCFELYKRRGYVKNKILLYENCVNFIKTSSESTTALLLMKLESDTEAEPTVLLNLRRPLLYLLREEWEL
jgi:hypothetical protein